MHTILSNTFGSSKCSMISLDHNPIGFCVLIPKKHFSITPMQCRRAPLQWYWSLYQLLLLSSKQPKYYSAFQFPLKPVNHLSFQLYSSCQGIGGRHIVGQSITWIAHRHSPLFSSKTSWSKPPLCSFRSPLLSFKLPQEWPVTFCLPHSIAFCRPKFQTLPYYSTLLLQISVLVSFFLLLWQNPLTTLTARNLWKGRMDGLFVFLTIPGYNPSL